jgi:hypothetical protein
MAPEWDVEEAAEMLDTWEIPVMVKTVSNRVDYFLPLKLVRL